MNSLEFLVVLAVTAIGALFIYAAHFFGYKKGRREGYLNGRAVSQRINRDGH
jgi:hypothetical protein